MIPTSPPPSTIRIDAWIPAMESDIPAIALLIGELGYPVDPVTMADRLDRLHHMAQVVPSSLILARDTASNGIVGLAHVVIPVHPEMDVTAEIWALVVSSDQRGNRIGQRLVASAEAWAKDQGAESIRLHTNVLRTDAHRFYERIGFEHIKTSRSYARNL